MLLRTSYIVNIVNKKFDRQSKENFNAKTEIRKDKSKTRDKPNEKKKPNHSQRKQESGGKKESDNGKKRNVNGVVHMCSDRLSTEMIESKEYFCGTH